jgi:alpha-D-ribose 1-methylphosphonate 5-triphosphate synthase subunit PhnH
VQHLEGGFADPPRHAAHAFRGALQALSRPGRIERLPVPTPPAPGFPRRRRAVLTLCDATTPLHLAPSHDTEALRGWITFHTAAPLVGAERAAFALGTWEALQPHDRFAIGTRGIPGPFGDADRGDARAFGDGRAPDRSRHRD